MKGSNSIGDKRLERLWGLIVVPDGFDAHVEIGGLSALLRHVLALQEAGVSEIRLVGSDRPPSDPRIHIPVTLGGIPQGNALVVPADVTYHRLLPFRLASLPVGEEEVQEVGHPRPILIAGSSRTPEVVKALLRGDPLSNTKQQSLLSNEFVLPIADSKQRREALEVHLKSLVKPTSGYFERLYMRPLSKHMTRALSATAITPNQMSVVTLLLALLSAYLVALPERSFCIAGGLLHIFMRIVDCVDGELARLRYQGSRFGEWIDSVGDGIGLAAFVAAVTLRVVPQDPNWLSVGVIGVAAWCAVQGLQYYSAILEGGTGCFQHIEWGHRAEKKTGIETLVSRIELALRIDAISTYYGVLVILDMHRTLLAIHCVSSLAALFYFSNQVRKLRHQ